MRRTEDLPALIAQIPGAAKTGCMLLTGTVISWDATSGYIIQVMGTQLTGVPVLASAGALAAGDVIAVLRQKNSYFILGKIIPAGG